MHQDTIIYISYRSFSQQIKDDITTNVIKLRDSKQCRLLQIL